MFIPVQFLMFTMILQHVRENDYRLVMFCFFAVGHTCSSKVVCIESMQTEQATHSSIHSWVAWRSLGPTCSPVVTASDHSERDVVRHICH